MRDASSATEEYKKEVLSQYKDLNSVLYGEIPEKWWLKSNFIRHYKNILYLFVHSRSSLDFAGNFKKAFDQVGAKNIMRLLLLELRLFDEMAVVNRNYKNKNGHAEKIKNVKGKKFYLLPEVNKNESMTSYERFETAVKLKEPDRIPITPLMDYYYAANNNMSPKDFVLGPFEAVFAAVKNTHNRFNGVLDMVHVPMGRIYAFMNWLPLAQSGYYGELKYPDKVPDSLQFIEKGYINVKDFKKIKKFGLRSIWKPVDLKKIRDTQSDLLKIMDYINYWEGIKKVPIYATSGIVTPLEGLCYIMGINNWSRALKKNREEVKDMCEFLLKGTMANNHMMYLLTQVKRTYICLERVSATFLSPKNFEELVLPNLLTMVRENVKRGLTTVFHLDTNWTPFFHYFLEFPKNGRYILHIEDSDIFKAKEMLGDRFCLMGNIQTRLLRFGTKQQIIDYTMKLIEGCAEGGGYMMAEGCEIAPDTPMENMKVWIDTTLKHGKY